MRLSTYALKGVHSKIWKYSRSIAFA